MDTVEGSIEALKNELECLTNQRQNATNKREKNKFRQQIKAINKLIKKIKNNNKPDKLNKDTDINKSDKIIDKVIPLKYSEIARNNEPKPSIWAKETAIPKPEPVPAPIARPNANSINTPLTSEMLNFVNPSQQKQMIGDRLFPKIQHRAPKLAGKITGMLLEMDSKELLHLLDDKTVLMSKINEVLALLNSDSQNDAQTNFNVGDLVDCRWNNMTWKQGTVTAINPLKVKPKGWSEDYDWDEVRYRLYLYVTKMKVNVRDTSGFDLPTISEGQVVHVSSVHESGESCMIKRPVVGWIYRADHETVRFDGSVVLAQWNEIMIRTEDDHPSLIRNPIYPPPQDSYAESILSDLPSDVPSLAERSTSFISFDGGRTASPSEFRRSLSQVSGAQTTSSLEESTTISWAQKVSNGPTSHKSKKRVGACKPFHDLNHTKPTLTPYILQALCSKTGLIKFPACKIKFPAWKPHTLEDFKLSQPIVAGLPDGFESGEQYKQLLFGAIVEEIRVKLDKDNSRNYPLLYTLYSRKEWNAGLNTIDLSSHDSEYTAGKTDANSIFLVSFVSDLETLKSSGEYIFVAYRTKKRRGKNRGFLEFCCTKRFYDRLLSEDCFIRILGSFTPDLRIYKALLKKTGPPILPVLLNGRFDVEEGPEVTHPKLNEFQLGAVKAMLSETQIVTVKGPPGTGKTVLLAAYLIKLKERNNEDTVLIVGASNAAVANIRLTLVTIAIGDPQNVRFPEFMVVGKLEALAKFEQSTSLIEETTLSARVDNLVQCWYSLKDTLWFINFQIEHIVLSELQEQLDKLDDFENTFEIYFQHGHHPIEGQLRNLLKDACCALRDAIGKLWFSENGMLSNVFDEEVLNFIFDYVGTDHHLIKQLEIIITKGQRKFVKKNGLADDESLHSDIHKLIVNDATYIFSTLETVSKLGEQGVDAKIAVCDEFGLVNDLKFSLLLQFDNLKYIRGVGDEQQLESIVNSEQLIKANFARSVFERLQRLGVQPHVLLKQYRMHPAICEPPNELSYEGLLQHARETGERGLHASSRGLDEVFSWPLVCINVNAGRECQTYKLSFYNQLEVGCTRKLLDHLFQHHPELLTTKTIGIICMYKAQVHRMQVMVDNFKEQGCDVEITVATVDSFQGSERDIIFLSTSRSNNNKSVGFLNARRINVAVTRAKDQLVVLCNEDTLQHSDEFKKYLAQLRRHGNFFNFGRFPEFKDVESICEPDPICRMKQNLEKATSMKEWKDVLNGNPCYEKACWPFGIYVLPHRDDPRAFSEWKRSLVGCLVAHRRNNPPNDNLFPSQSTTHLSETTEYCHHHFKRGGCENYHTCPYRHGITLPVHILEERDGQNKKPPVDLTFPEGDCTFSKDDDELLYDTVLNRSKNQNNLFGDFTLEDKLWLAHDLVCKGSTASLGQAASMHTTVKGRVFNKKEKASEIKQLIRTNENRRIPRPLMKLSARYIIPPLELLSKLLRYQKRSLDDMERIKDVITSTQLSDDVKASKLRQLRVDEHRIEDFLTVGKRDTTKANHRVQERKKQNAEETESLVGQFLEHLDIRYLTEENLRKMQTEAHINRRTPDVLFITPVVFEEYMIYCVDVKNYYGSAMLCEDRKKDLFAQLLDTSKEMGRTAFVFSLGYCESLKEEFIQYYHEKAPNGETIDAEDVIFIDGSAFSHQTALDKKFSISKNLATRVNQFVVPKYDDLNQEFLNDFFPFNPPKLAQVEQEEWNVMANMMNRGKRRGKNSRRRGKNNNQTKAGLVFALLQIWCKKEKKH